MLQSSGEEGWKPASLQVASHDGIKATSQCSCSSKSTGFVGRVRAWVVITTHHTLQTFLISPKEKTTVWVKQNVNFFQQNGSVIKIEQN
jgi:hypothetical protein